MGLNLTVMTHAMTCRINIQGCFLGPVLRQVQELLSAMHIESSPTSLAHIDDALLPPSSPFSHSSSFRSRFGAGHSEGMLRTTEAAHDDLEHTVPKVTAVYSDRDD